MFVKYFSTLAMLVLSTQAGLAGPKEDCALAVQHLGYPIDKYSFVEAGIFAMERHVFDGVVICYVTFEKTIDSIYRGEVVLVENGYFGPEALQKKEALENKRQMQIDTAYKVYEAARKQIVADTEKELQNLLLSSDPFVNGGKKTEVISEKPEVKPAATIEPQPKQDAEGEPSTTTELRPEQEANPAAVKKPSSDVIKWTTAERLTIRTCPSQSCGVTGWVTDGAKLTIYEERNGWSRIEELRGAMCINGKSGAVDSGNNTCTAANGIVEDQFARWVSSKYLSDSKPEVPDTVTGCDSLGLENSDNYRKYAKQFCTAATRMINDRKCAAKDFREWSWSSSPAKGQDYYFTYCGGLEPSNRYYLNIRTGAISQ
jgi:hypothetical protein